MDEQRAWLKARRKRRLRILAVMLSVCVLFTTYPDILATLSVFASEEQAQAEGRYISGFTALSNEIREQTVPVGTELTELSLPDTLEAVVTKQPSEDTAGQPEEDGKEDSGENDGEESDGDTTGTEDKDSSTGETEEGEPSDSGQENTEENKDADAGEETGDEQDTQPEKDGESEETDGKADAGDEDTADTEEEENTEESAPAEKHQESAVSQETHTVTMQEYHAENAISVQTLENTQTEKQEETVTIDGVSWQSEPEYDGNTEGTYTFTAVLPEGYTLAEGVSLPEITVIVESGIDTIIQALLDRIAALPDAEEYLATEPDMEEDEDAYAEWEEKLYEYVEEALAIWEEYEALTEEQQAQISEEELAKLKAWMEIVETLSDHAVMLADDSEHHAGWTALSSSDTELIGGNYYLAGPVIMGTITIKGDVTLCLNGQTLTHSGDTGSVIVVESGTFTLCDCQDDYTYIWEGSKENPVYTLDGSGGCITGGKGYNSLGGGVYVKSNANFIMNSGRITRCDVGNEQGHYGGGVYVEAGATFEMTGGFIENNSAGIGGGVYVYGSFIMSDEAVIMKNNGDSAGGGVACEKGTTTIIRGGKILGNTSGGLGGGVRCGGVNSTLTMEGGLIEGNSAGYGGGGLHVPGQATLVLSGGTIRYNRMPADASVSVDAGGVRLASNASTLKLSGSISIYDNYYKDGSISNIYLPKNASVTITGPLTNRVGITSLTKPPKGSGDNGAVLVANENTSEDYDWHCIVSDENYRVIKSGNQILLAERTGNPVTITAYKDGLEWVENPPTYKLTSDNGTSFVTDLTAVPDGEYDIYDGDINTNVTVDVNGAAATAEVYYHTVTFYDGDTVLTTPAQQIVLKDKQASAPAASTNPTKTGCTFDKWVIKKDGGSSIAYDFTKAVTEKTSLYASWTADQYTITYDGMDDATLSPKPEKHTYGKDTTIGNPTKTGYTFAGWKVNNGNTAVKELVLGAKDYTADITLTATWTPEQYDITYNGIEGATLSPQLEKHTYGTETTISDPTKTGYTFAGWKVNDSTTPTTNLTLSATGYTAAITLTATWTPNTYQVTFDNHGADGGNTTTSKDVTYDGTYGDLPAPSKTGYTFKGWYTKESGQGSKVTADTKVTTADNHTLHAYWKDETPPAKPVLQDGVTLPTVWTNDQDTIPLKLYDGVGVTALLVSVDGSPYTEVSGFSGIGSVNYSYTDVQEGEHKYQFKAVDAAGNFAESDIFPIKLDQTKPVIGTLTYDNAVYENLWHWIIGKKSMVVHVPVTDAGSGVEKISYTMTPRDAAGNLDSSSAKTKTATVTNGEAKITFDKDFRGTITINCTDKAGNAADSVTIGADAGGVIVEDTPPIITVLADRNISDTQQTQPSGVAVSEEYYNSAPALIVTVKDDTGNAITAGIATVTYQVEGSAEKSVTVDTSVLQEEVTFTIPASEIPTGITEIKVTATDNAGNGGNEAAKTFTLKVKGPEKQPAAAIDYREEELTGLVPGGKYTINGTEDTADGEGRIPIKDGIDNGWFGTTVNIVKKGNGSETSDSPAQSLSVPARTAVPNTPELSTRDDKSITLKTILNAQYRLADGTDNWQDSTAFTGLAQKTIYRFRAYYPATDTSFASPESGEAQIATMPTAPTPDKLRIGYAAETLTLTDGIEAFTDANCTTPVTDGSVEDYMGQTVYIRYPANGIIPASQTTAVSIPARPAKPAPGKEDASYPKATDGAITGLTPGTTYEYRVKEADGNFGAWKAATPSGTKIENLPAGDYEVRVKAVETGNASFQSEAAAVTIGATPATKYETPKIRIDYPAETLTGFVPGAKYTIGSDTITAGADGTLPIKKEWFGITLSITRNGNEKDKLDSDPQSLPIPARPAKPMPTGVDVSTAGGTGKLTGLTAGTTYEVSTDGGKTWASHTADGSGQITGLLPGTYVVRVKAGADHFVSEPSDSVKIGAYQIKVTFMVDGAKYREVSVDYGAALADIPPVPVRENAVGAWCMDEQGTTPAAFTNVTADMTVYAVYTVAYTVTLQSGTGYTLSAVNDSKSPVKEGGSFTFRLALREGYEKGTDFAVRVSGVKVELTANDTYTITDIRENQAVTVEGVAKKLGGGSSNLPGGGGNNGSDEPQPTPPPSQLPDDTPSTPPEKPPVKPMPAEPETTPPPEEKEPEGRKPDSTPEPEETPEPQGPKNNETKSQADTPEPPADATQPTPETTRPTAESGPESTKPDSTPKPEETPGPRGPENDETKPQAEPSQPQIPDAAPESLTYSVGKGAVIVTLNNVDETVCAAKVADASAVAQAVLSEEELAGVKQGQTIEIRIDVEHLETVLEEDAGVIDGGIEDCQEQLPGLVMGMYVDISMYMRVGSGDWNAIHATKEPVEIILNVPDELAELAADFYIMRAHEGEYLLMEDLDDAAETITIKTEAFSTYAILYQLQESAGGKSATRCSLCHICPTFLGICYFIWLAIIILIMIVVIMLLRKKKEEQEAQDTGQ